MGSPTTASVPNAAGSGRNAGFNPDVHTGNHVPSTSQSIHQQGAGPSLLTAQIMQPARAVSAQEQFMQSAAPSYNYLYSQFTQAQRASASAIIRYMMNSPKTAIPCTYITAELAEIKGTRGRCLIGPCAAEDKMKRVDHLYDHIRDKHFESRPYACNFWEHDLKRHSLIHDEKSMECQMCSKSYIRFDNLQRHMQQKHGKSMLSSKLSL
ncbi:SubName: Full=Uncharacterized protein {ECO:0000313/EMBL:CCA76731.1} [Serendipita indica DSM 11827]|nr:SubName: Full=Uncharacterized protein {ECO:0000313/EMBL:CCA76731.1} [Serendipita indica DSM 11827]